MNLSKKVMQIISVLFAAFVFTIGGNAAGNVDLSFDGSVQNEATGLVKEIVKLADGKIIIGGNFTAASGHSANSIARYNADGTIDKTFNPPDSFKSKNVHSIGVQSNGKILVSIDIQVVRLNADGSLDATFAPTNPNNVTPYTVRDIKVLADDKFYLAGELNGFSGGPHLRRYNADGTLDNTFEAGFNSGVFSKIALQPDGKVVGVGLYIGSATGFVKRFNTGGGVDGSFAEIQTGGIPYDLGIQTDGKIVFAGQFTNVNGSPKKAVARVNSDGSIDANFTQGGLNINGNAFAVKIRPDGKILLGGKFNTSNPTRNNLILLNTDGTIDTSFTADLSSQVIQVIEINENGKILGGFYYDNAVQFGGIFSFNANGSRDLSSAYFTDKTATAREVIEQPDGKIIVAGLFNIANNVVRQGIARFNTDGTLDTGFIPAVPVGQMNSVAVALQADGKILVNTNTSNQPLVRLNPDGSLDNTFNPNLINSSISEILVLSGGKILVGGNLNNNGGNASIARFNTDGSLDAAFVPTAIIGGPTKMVVLPSGKFLAKFGSRLVRFNENGTLDNTFSSILEVTGEIFDIDVQTDGKIVVAGSFTSLAGNNAHKFIGRLSPDGLSDPTFSVGLDGFASAVKVQPDGKILIGGQFAFVNGVLHTGLVRLNTDLSIDSTFTASTNDIVWNITILNSGKIFIAGGFTRVSGISRVLIARLNNDLVPQKTRFDFDGDGRADISVFRPSNNVWYQLLGQNYQFSAKNFGIDGDIAAPADFDGDGKTDFAVFRPSTGSWWYAASSAGGQFRAVQWGTSGDIPLPADINGDGKDDYVVYRPSNNTWYRLQEGGAVSSLVFGIEGDKPLIGDFDGDGKSDYAIYRPSTGVWWYAASSANNDFRAVQWGTAEDVPVPADYDGDGKTDFAVFRPSNGGWYIAKSGGGTTLLQFGLGGDRPVAADYDGDGKADIAVFRPSTGVWYLLRTTSGFGALQWGSNGDVAIPNAFTRQ